MSQSKRASRIARYHTRARDRGVNPIVYWIARGILQPFFHLYFRLSRIGREHIPESGPVIFACNHRSFLDPFILGVCSRRPIYYVAKREIFANPIVAWFVGSLGAFPVHRGAGDADMLATARAILARGDCVVLFPEGTRTRPGALGRPKRGVGRLALETGAPVVPVAMKGTEAVRKGWRIRPHKVRVRIGRPLTFPQVEPVSPQLAAAVTDRIWPNVMLQWEWLGGLPPLRRAAIIGAGSSGTRIAVMLARSGLHVDLGVQTRAEAEQLAADLPAAVNVVRAGDLELSRHDLVCFAVAAAALPAAVAAHGGAIAPRTGVLVMSSGLVPPLGALPSAFVSERVSSWAVGVLAGPAHDALENGSSLVLATTNPAFARQVGDALTAARLAVSTTIDLVGVELAACAADAAALAAAAAAEAGPNVAGAAAGRVFGEIDAYARREGSRPETFAGLAGAGDLVAATLDTRHRRAGELLAQGVAAQEISSQTAEALESVPLLAARVGEAGVDAPILKSLAGLIEGRVEPRRFTSSLTAPSRKAKAGTGRAA